MSTSVVPTSPMPEWLQLYEDRHSAFVIPRFYAEDHNEQQIEEARKHGITIHYRNNPHLGEIIQNFKKQCQKNDQLLNVTESPHTEQQASSEQTIPYKNAKVVGRALILALIVGGLVTGAVFAGMAAHGSMGDAAFTWTGNYKAGALIGCAIGASFASVSLIVSSVMTSKRIFHSNGDLGHHLMINFLVGAGSFVFLPAAGTGGIAAIACGGSAIWALVKLAEKITKDGW